VSKPTVGSLFAGIGGLDLGLERAGFQVAWQVERDEYARRVLEKHWPGVPRYRDVRYFLGGKRWRSVRQAWSVDLLAGGFPCQDISYAGKGAGLAGERSGLWFEFARVIRLLRPRFVFVENVAALLVRGMGRVLGDLAACGYDAEWDCIPAAALGAPHRRDRVFLVAYARSVGLEGPVHRRNGSTESRGIDSRRAAAGRGASAQVVADSSRVQQGRQKQRAKRERVGPCCQSVFPDADGEPLEWFAESRSERGPWFVEPDVGRVADGVPDRVDRLRGLGNAVVPQVAEWIGRRVMEAMKANV
jgi:DNA (cytosine-5)-methyltransferase 1